MTPLQAYVYALGDLVLDSRDELTPEEYTWFIAVACELVGVEAARLIVAEAIRATRIEDAAA